ncbi:hypothetical protein HY572_01195 [Candidatus Micrarchaeota archaeon]|nr:hypothetical protein [Candidatus Micrarchaeota archaeon]
MASNPLLSWTLILLGVGSLLLGLWHANQYLIQQATIEPSLQQLEQLEQAGLAGTDLEQTRQLLAASTTALIQSMLIDAILGLIFLVAGFWLTPTHSAHNH